MSLPSLQEWKTATHKWFSVRNGAIARIDEKLGIVEREPLNRTALTDLKDAIEAFKREKNEKYGDYTQSAREGAGKNITNLESEVGARLHLLDLRAQICLAKTVCAKLFDVRIADVDFSDTVRAAAQAKMIAGKSLYQTVKDDWESPARLADWQGHERLLFQSRLGTAKVMNGTGMSPLADLDKIAAVVKRHRYAVCESIAATFISESKVAGFSGRLEWLGIPYGVGKGHCVCVVNRSGTLSDPMSWGDDVFIVDLWYYNLGMRSLYLWSDDARNHYIRSEIVPYLSTQGGLKVIADIS
ncbi:MAG: hypothetical protein ACJ8R9_27040 [Steroidobacteraceae bacterium]